GRVNVFGIISRVLAALFMIGRIDHHVFEILLNIFSLSLMVTMSIEYPSHLSSLKWNSRSPASVKVSPVSVVSASLAQSMTWVLRLHLDYSDSSQQETKSQSATGTTQKAGWVSMRYGIFAAGVVLTGIGVLVYLKRSKM
ncbi:unnamed protein product, partial [Ilex paraguariensis]